MSAEGLQELRVEQGVRLKHQGEVESQGGGEGTLWLFVLCCVEGGTGYDCQWNLSLQCVEGC